jgi:hypothetical protein
MTHPNLYDVWLASWRNERAWLRHQITVRCDQFESTYKPRSWRVYPRARKSGRASKWLEEHPVAPVPMAPEDWRDPVGRVWEMLQVGILPTAAFHTMFPKARRFPREKDYRRTWVSWGNLNPPTIMQLVATNSVDAPMTVELATAYRDDFVAIRELLQYYAWLGLTFARVTAVFHDVEVHREAARQVVQSNRKRAVAYQLKQEKRMQARGSMIQAVRKPGVLDPLPEVPEGCIPDYPASWPAMGGLAASVAGLPEREEHESEKSMGDFVDPSDFMFGPPKT